MKKSIRTTSLLLLMLLGLCGGANAQFNVIHNFEDSTGRYPRGLITDGTLLYGATAVGGANNEGVIFSVNSDGTDYKVLYTFSQPHYYGVQGNLAVWVILCMV